MNSRGQSGFLTALNLRAVQGVSARRLAALGARAGVFVVLLVAAGLTLLACKQRILNDRSRSEAVSGVYNQRAHFLWPVVQRTGSEMKDVSVCWYEANRPWPEGASEGYRFSAQELREIFLQSKSIRSASGPAQYVAFESFAKEARQSGLVASAKNVGTLGLCAGAAVGAQRLASQGGGSKKGLIMATAAALFCGASLVRGAVAKPSAESKVVDNKVHRNLEQYLKTAFNEDNRLAAETHQALVKIVVTVVGRTPPNMGRGACPEPTDALRDIERQMTADYDSLGSARESTMENPASGSP